MMRPWRRRDLELDEEIRAHLAMAAQERVASGAAPEDAAFAARREFGNVTLVKESTRATWSWSWLGEIAREARLAVRSLRHRPGFTATAVLSFALAIALNTTLYSVLDAMLDPQIDVSHPEQVFGVRFYGDPHHRLDIGAVDRALNAGIPGIAGVTGFRAISLNATVDHSGHVRQTRVPLQVRSNFFAFLGMHPLVGRLTRTDETMPQVVISDRYVDALFPDDRLPIGRTIRIDRKPYVVTGVVHRYPAFPLLEGDVWVLASAADDRGTPASLIRLRPGVDSLEVRREAAVISRALTSAAGEPVSDGAFGIKPFEKRQFRILWFHYALISAVLGVLLVACANLANLQLARGIGRSRELALRTALGASRRQLVRTLVLEVSLLAAAGLGLGLVFTMWGIRLVRASIPPTVADFMIEPQTSWRLVAFAAAAATACVVLVGLLPAMRVSRVDPNDLLKSGAGTGAHRGNRRRYGLLLVVQIGLALPLVSGAALLLRSLEQLLDPAYLSHQIYGYDPLPLVIAHVQVDMRDGPKALGPLAEDLVARARALPGVTDAGVSVETSPDSDMIVLEDAGSTKVVPAPMWSYVAVTPSYLRARGLGVGAGRDFMAGETDVPVAVVGMGTARYLWGGADAVGRMMKLGSLSSNAPWVRVVGVQGDPRDAKRMEETNPYYGHSLGEVFRVITPRDTLRAKNRIPSPAVVTLMVRSSSNAAAVATALRQKLGDMPSLRAFVFPMTQQLGIDRRRTTLQFIAAMFTVFAVLGLVLAALGIYGIVAYSVADRRRELAVRISLGARPADIVHATIREGNVVALAGVAVGLYLTLETKGWLSTFLTTWDDLFNPIFFLLIGMALFAVAAAAALIPALRAARLDPIDALKND